jgi:hypothetical protein
MTTRERWIVYPLLFMAIGLGLRSGLLLQEMEKHAKPEAALRKLASESVHANTIQSARGTFDQLSCHALTVLGPDNKPVVVIAANSQSHDGMIETIAGDGTQWLLIHPRGTQRGFLPSDRKKTPAAPKDPKANDAKTEDQLKADETDKGEKSADPSTKSK